MRRSAFQAFLLLSALLLAGCGGISASAPSAASGSPAPSTILAQPTAPLSVYIGSKDGTVSALDAASGAVRWRSQIADASATTVAALAEGVVYVSAYDTRNYPFRAILYAFRASDGTVLWHQASSGASMVALAAVSQGTVYLTFSGEGSASSPPNEIEALRAQDGSVLWHIRLEGTGPVKASVATGTLYVTSPSSLLPSPGYYYASTYLYALNPSTGAARWQRQLSRTDAVIEVAAGQVYLLDTGTDVVCDPSMLHVLDASSGAEQWQMSGSFQTFIGVEQGRAYVEDEPEACTDSHPFEHGRLSALHTTDGSSAWQITIPFGPGSIANGALYVPAEDGDLAAYSAGNGSRLWRAQGESGGLRMFTGVLYTSIEGRGLDALDPATGAVEWRYQTSDGVSVSSVANGVLYGVIQHLTPDMEEDHAIVALQVGTGKLLWRAEIGTTYDSPIVG